MTGSTRLVTTGSTINFATNYLAFGGNYSTSGSETFMYTGKPFDPTSGLYYYNARAYFAAIGRFMTEDTMTGKLTDPLSQNRYIYASDNPMMYVDPTGHRYEVSSGGGGNSGGTSGSSSSGTTTPNPTPPPASGGGGSSSTSSGGGVTATSTQTVTLTSDGGDSSGTKLSVGAYFLNVFLPEHYGILVDGFAGFVLSLLGPGVVAALGGENNIFEAAVGLLTTELALDAPTLAADIQHKDVAGFEGELATMGFQVAKSIATELNPFDFICAVTLDAGFDAATDGVSIAAASATLAASGAVFAGEFAYSWNSYQNG